MMIAAFISQRDRSGPLGSSIREIVSSEASGLLSFWRLGFPNMGTDVLLEKRLKKMTRHYMSRLRPQTKWWRFRIPALV
jgi:hypothetical protein